MAKTDGEHIFIYTMNNAIPINKISTVKRQTLKGSRGGVDIVYTDGRVQSERFPMLNGYQLDEIVNFLNGKQI